MAAARRQELDIGHEVAAALGRSAVQAAHDGRYIARDGRSVVWRDLVQAACAAKVSIAPDVTLPGVVEPAFAETTVQVTNETTLGAARRLVAQGRRALALKPDVPVFRLDAGVELVTLAELRARVARMPVRSGRTRVRIVRGDVRATRARRSLRSHAPRRCAERATRRFERGDADAPGRWGVRKRRPLDRRGDAPRTRTGDRRRSGCWAARNRGG